MASLKYFSLVLSLIGICAGQQPTFSNRIDDLDYQDPPSILHMNGYYYLSVTDGITFELVLFKSDKLSSFRGAERKAWYPFRPPGSGEAAPEPWAPKLYILYGHLYLYFAARQGQQGKWTLYGTRARNASDPMGEWETPIEMLQNWSPGAIDGAILEHAGRNYFLWNGDHSNVAGIYIAQLLTPLQAARPYNLIKYPSERWECEGRCTSEAPFFIYQGNVSYMVITTSAPHHRMTYSSITDDKNPMDPNSWTAFGAPVFDKNDEENVFNVGHATFTDSPDGTETWMMYVANLDPDVLVSYAAIDRVDWNPDGTPNFPLAHGVNSSMPVPSGEVLNAGT